MTDRTACALAALLFVTVTCTAAYGTEPPGAEPTATAPAAAPEPEASPEPSSSRIVVWVRPEGITKRQARILEAFTIRELDKLEGIAPVSPAEAYAAQPNVCAETEGCLARVAAALGTSRIVTANVRRVHESEVLTLKLLDLDSVEILNIVSLSVDRNQGALTALGEAVRRLFADIAPEQGATVGVATDIAARWSPQPVNKWLFFGGIGASAVGVTSAIIVSLLFVNAQNNYNTLASSGTLGTISGSDLIAQGNSAASLATVANALWVTTGLLITGTIVGGIFTDWGNDAVLTPVLSADGGGGAFAFRF